MGVTRVKEAKLASVIFDAMPLDIDWPTARRVVDIIFQTIAKGVERDGTVTIQGLGRFYKFNSKGRRKALNMPIGGNKPKLIKAGVEQLPDRVVVKFEACRSLRRSLDDGA